MKSYKKCTKKRHGVIYDYYYYGNGYVVSFYKETYDWGFFSFYNQFDINLFRENIHYFIENHEYV